MSEHSGKTSFWNKIHIDLPLLLIILALLSFSLIVIWSASGQSISMTKSKAIQIAASLIVMVIFAQIPPRTYEYWAPHLYSFCLILLILVELYGDHSKGAQRWLDLGFIRFQPSEIVKIAVPLMVARFINRDGCPPKFISACIVLILIAIPALLVAIQPDLGTAVLIILSGVFILFFSGVSWKLIFTAMGLLAIFLPIAWNYLLYPYQRNRITIFLHPETDLLNDGWNIIQSEIAIGSGGIWGKGWLQGTQSQLEFLPEHHTDFIFSVIAEEFGLVGSIILLLLYLCLIIRGLMIALQVQTVFGRILVGGLILTFMVYVYINIGMVSGLLPVVGVPLPLISYGGTALLMLMTSFGIIMSIHTHRKLLSRNV